MTDIRDAGPDPDLLNENIGRLWLVYSFPTDGVASVAWESIQKNTKFLSAWRTRQPLKPPHRIFQVWVIGEDHAQMEHAERICADLGKPSDPSDATDMIYSLRRRRQDQAVDSIVKGTVGKKTTLRNESGWTLDRQGRLHPQ